MVRNMKRKPIYPAQRLRILRENDYHCIYCGGQASAVDHIIPYAYTPENKDENLIAACEICNSIAGSQVFDSLIDKQSYILHEREKPKWKRMIAAQIQIPIPVEQSRTIPEEAKVERKKKKPVIEHPLRPLRKHSEPLPVIKYYRPKRVIAYEPIVIPKPKPPVNYLATILADLLVRLYDNKEYCMHEIYTFYAITGCR